jgi:enoyl-CoA hydratase/carnithine racemase
MSEWVNVSCDQQGVMTVELCRHHKKNALTGDMYSAIARSFREAMTDPTVRAVILRGGQDFSAGNDIADFLEGGIADGSPVMQFLHALADLDKPLLAAVRGAAVGVGTTVLLHCDAVYAHPDTRFSMPFVRLGLCPEAASSALLARQVGPLLAKRWLMLGEEFGAGDALAAGLLTGISEEPESAVEELAGRLAAMSPAALLSCKRLIKEHSGLNLHEIIDREAEDFKQLLVSPEARAAFKAFLGR